MRKFFGLLLLLACCQANTWAQQVFEIDPITRQISAPLPFDQPILVKISDPHKSIDSVFLFDLFVRKGRLLDEVNTLFGVKKSTAFYKGVAFFREENAYLPIPGLEPDLHFEIILEHKFKGSAFEAMLEVVHQYAQSPGEGYQALLKLSNKLEPPIDEGGRTAIGKWWSYNASRNAANPSQAVEQYQIALSDYFQKTLIPIYKKAADLSDFEYVTAMLHLKDSSLSKLARSYAKIDKTAADFAWLWRALSEDQGQAIFNGTKALSDQTNSCEVRELVKRSHNIKSSLQSIEKLISKTFQIQTRDMHYRAYYDSLLSDLKNIEQKLVANKKHIDQTINQLSKELDKEPNMRYTTWYTGTNEVRDLKTLGSYVIIPHIGVTQIVTPNDQNNFVKPYFGVSFHLRQVNKTVKLRELNNTLLHRLAIQVGLTASEIRDDQGEYSDLLNSMSLMAGINFKLNHILGVSTGAILMKRADPNPLISKKQTVANYYIGLTLDVDFAHALKGLTSKVGL